MARSARERFRVSTDRDLATVGLRTRPGARERGRVPRAGRGLVMAVALAGVMAGCGAPAPAPPSSTPPSSIPPATTTSAAAAPTAAGESPDDAVCAQHPASASTVRSIARAVENGPVLPAGVALFLIDARTQAARGGVVDPALAAAQAELLAAIDDLDAQGRANLPPGGNPAEDLVRLDSARVVAAVDVVERICAQRPAR
ncbi:MAG: hypothetical protein LH603_07395 [Pseudonocardia sp.]|nr:hypothetical protein [Pseudonocardia sp.]